MRWLKAPLESLYKVIKCNTRKKEKKEKRYKMTENNLS